MSHKPLESSPVQISVIEIETFVQYSLTVLRSVTKQSCQIEWKRKMDVGSRRHT